MRGNFTNKALSALTLLLITAVMATGCRKRQIVHQSDPASVRFSIVSSVPKLEVPGRAVTDVNNDFTTESQIGIYATAADQTDANQALPQNTNVGYFNPTGSTQWSAIEAGRSIKFLSEDQAMNFYAYHPYTSQSGTSVALDPNIASPTLIYTLPQDQSTTQALANADLMWGTKFNVGESSGVVSLEFSHKLSKLSFKINAGSDWGTEAVELSRLEIKGSEMAATAQLNISSGELTTGSELNTSVRCDYNPAIAFNELNACECQFITLPAQYTNIEVKLTVRGSISGEKVYTTTLSGVQLKAGHLRKMTISVYKTSSLAISLSPTIQPWEVISDISMEAI